MRRARADRQGGGPVQRGWRRPGLAGGERTPRAALAALATLALGAVLAAGLAGCVSRGATPSRAGIATPTDAATAATRPAAAATAAAPVSAAPTLPASDLQATLVSRSLWPGPEAVLLALEDASNAPVGGTEVRVRVAVAGAAGSTGAGSRDAASSGAGPLRWVSARYERLAADGRGIYAADVVLPRPGEVTLVVEAIAFGVAHRATAAVRVRDPGTTPAVGSPAPRVDTPTFASAGGDLAHVTTDPVPDRRLYWISVRQAIEAHRPFVLVLDSFAFRPSPACGGALGIVHHLADEYPSVSFIHAEAWATRVVDGRLAADPPGGALRPAAWSAAWGATSAPWIFVVDASGIVRAKFSGIVGTDEVRAAIRSVAGWVPSY